MDAETLVKVGLIAIPLTFFGVALLRRLRWALRVPAGIVFGIAVAFGLALLFDRGDLSYLVTFATMGSIYAILALGLNTQWGYTGHLNFGIAGFFAIGAFTSALFTTDAPTGMMAQYTQQAFGLEMPFLVGVLAAAVISGVAAFLIAIPVLRLRMDFLAIATIGIAEIIRLVFQNERWLANGPQPLRGVPQPLHCAVENPPCEGMPGWLAAVFEPLQSRDYIFLYMVFASIMLVAVYLLLESAVRSPWGRVLRATRDEEASTAMSGKNVPWVRIQSFVVGAVVMGIGGAVYAHYVVTIDYSHFNPLFATFIIWVMLMLGGSGNNMGAVLGAFIIWGVWSGTAFLTGALEPALAAIDPDLPARAAYLRWMLVALLLAGIVLFRPQGILAEETSVSRHASPARGYRWQHADGGARGEERQAGAG